MPTPTSIDGQTFLTKLLESELVSADELALLEDSLPVTTRGKVLARALVERGVLTRFQAERLLAGRTGGFILGQYRILDELGKGGMGRVFKAVHQTMSRVVAIKVLSPQLVETKKAQELFLREMRAVAQLMHPNLVAAYDANQVGNRSYLVMEYVDGPNLDKLVREHGPLPIGLACELIRQAATGLQYAFDMGMVHRDIKPSNLLVQFPSPESRRRHTVLKILDFGLARLAGASGDSSDVATIITRPNMIMGTPDFVSPEQAHDLHSADIRSDLYSLGCTFYYLLTGQVPFPGGGTVEKLVRHSTTAARPIRELRPEAPDAVVAVVERLMAKQPNDRFETPGDLVAALHPFAVDEPLPVRESAKQVSEAQHPAPPSTDDPFATPAGTGSGDELNALCWSSDEMTALSTPRIGDSAPTVCDTTLAFPRRQTAPSRRERRRVRLAIAAAIGLVGGLGAIMYLLSLYL
jgi:eukaryotic-like serine/threonine-protein kinase